MVKRVVGILLLVVVILAIGFGIRYREELKMLKYMGTDVTQVQEQEEKLREEQDALREAYQVPDITLSQEDLEAIANGEKTIEEVAQAALEAGSSESASSQDPVQSADQSGSQTGNSGSQSSSAQTDPKQAQIQSLLTQVYALQASMNGQVDGIVSNMKSQYAASGGKGKAQIVQSNMAAITALEASCDSQMSGLVASLKELDPDLGAQIQQYYENAKEAKKASIIAQYS